MGENEGSRIIEIYTDGSCHTQQKKGAWAALIFIDGQKKVMQGTLANTTHNHMELLAVIRAIDHIINQNIDFKIITIFSDSQYVVNLIQRKEKLKANDFFTRQGESIRNVQLVKNLIRLIEMYPVKLIKVAAHQKKTTKIDYNREVDMLVRSLLRKSICDNQRV